MPQGVPAAEAVATTVPTTTNTRAAATVTHVCDPLDKQGVISPDSEQHHEDSHALRVIRPRHEQSWSGFRPIVADPTSSYQPAHVSASLGGAPTFQRVALARRHTPVDSAASSVPTTRASYSVPLATPHARRGEPSMLLHPFPRGALSPWPSAHELSSEEGVRSSLPASFSHLWAPRASLWRASGHVMDTASTGAGVGVGVGPAHALLSPPSAPPLNGAHDEREAAAAAATVMAAPLVAAVVEPVPTPLHAGLVTPLVVCAAQNDSVDRDAGGCPLSRDVPRRTAEYVNGAPHHCDELTATTMVPLFASPLRRARTVERQKTEELALVARRRVLEYLDGQVHPLVSSAAASLTLSSAPRTPSPQPPRRQQEEAIQLPLPSEEVEALRATVHPTAPGQTLVAAPGAPPIDGGVAGYGASSVPSATPSLPHPHEVRAAGTTHIPMMTAAASGIRDVEEDVSVPLTTGSNATVAGSRTLSAIRRVRCPLCNDLVTFCPHDVTGAMLEPQVARRSPPLLRAHNECERRGPSASAVVVPAADAGLPADGQGDAGPLDNVHHSATRHATTGTTRRLLVPLSRAKLATVEEP